MIKEITTDGASVAEALDSALQELGVQQDAVDYEVLEEGGKRLFGLRHERASRVRVWLKPAFVSELEANQGSRIETEEIEGDRFVAGDVADDALTLSEEELDRIADAAASATQRILGGFGIEASIEEYEGDDGEIILDIVGDDLGVLIGRHGKTLDAIQTLVSATTNRALGFRHPVLVDVAGYRNRRRVKLEEIAARAAESAIRNGRPVKLRPMSSYERKVVHMRLRLDHRVSTSSEGNEPFRQVVVSLR